MIISITTNFSYQRLLIVFHWRLSDSKSPQVSRTIFSILAVFNNAVVWMVTRLPTSKSSRPFNNPLVTAPKAPITIGIIVTFMFHSFFNPLARSRYLSLFSHYYYYYYYFFMSFSHQHQPVVFHCGLTNSKSPQVTRNLLSILVDLNNAVDWIVSICLFTRVLWVVPSAPITTGIFVTFMFHIFSVLYQGLGMDLSFRFQFYPGDSRNGTKSTIR